jgi:hypothetical protein
MYDLIMRSMYYALQEGMLIKFVIYKIFVEKYVENIFF